MKNDDIVIDIQNLTKTYNLYNKPGDRVKEIFSITHKKYAQKYDALNNITFKVRKGETLGIIGKNGAGKSTLLKMITGVTKPTKGSIQVNGEISALLELGTGFNPEYNGYDNIFLNGSMRGYSREMMKDKLQEIIDFADIGDYINQPIKTYSSGMLARLAFAVMICFKPDILIVDEALSVGDVFFQQKCNTYMKEEMNGVTKLLVTHDMNSIANMADRVILLEKGRIIQEGKPLEVIGNYLKIMHTEVFEGNLEETQEKPPEFHDYMQLNGDWKEVTADNTGGAGDVLVEKVMIQINGTPSNVVKPGDEVSIRAIIFSKKECENIIIGYTFKDKYGNSIFAMNTIAQNILVGPIKQGGTYMFKIVFHWPEVKEGDYFLTLGLGEGMDQMIHIIQCWAHNIYHAEALALRPMHGIINHVIEDFDYKQME